jgi:hypothetical protein
VGGWVGGEGKGKEGRESEGLEWNLFRCLCEYMRTRVFQMFVIHVQQYNMQEV